MATGLQPTDAGLASASWPKQGRKNSELLVPACRPSKAEMRFSVLAIVVDRAAVLELSLSSTLIPQHQEQCLARGGGEGLRASLRGWVCCRSMHRFRARAEGAVVCLQFTY